MEISSNISILGRENYSNYIFLLIKRTLNVWASLHCLSVGKKKLLSFKQKGQLKEKY